MQLQLRCQGAAVAVSIASGIVRHMNPADEVSRDCAQRGFFCHQLRDSQCAVLQAECREPAYPGECAGGDPIIPEHLQRAAIVSTILKFCTVAQTLHEVGAITREEHVLTGIGEVPVGATFANETRSPAQKIREGAEPDQHVRVGASDVAQQKSQHAG